MGNTREGQYSKPASITRMAVKATEGAIVAVKVSNNEGSDHLGPRPLIKLRIL